MPAPAYEFPQRYRDALTALAALETLATARPLLPEATMTAGEEELRLREDEAVILPRLSDALAASLVRLVASRRPDHTAPVYVRSTRPSPPCLAASPWPSTLTHGAPGRSRAHA